MSKRSEVILAIALLLLSFGAGLFAYPKIFGAKPSVASVQPLPTIPQIVAELTTDNTFAVPIHRALSSVGKSNRLIIDWSQVQALQGPHDSMVISTPDSTIAEVDSSFVGSFRTAHGDSIAISFSSSLDSFIVSQWAGPLIKADTVTSISYRDVPLFRAQPLLFIGQDSRYSGNAGLGFEVEIGKNLRISIEAGLAIKSSPFYQIVWRYVFPWIRFG
jgi:hypothetical protein